MDRAHPGRCAFYRVRTTREDVAVTGGAVSSTDMDGVDTRGWAWWLNRLVIQEAVARYQRSGYRGALATPESSNLE